MKIPSFHDSQKIDAIKLKIMKNFFFTRDNIFKNNKIINLNEKRES